MTLHTDMLSGYNSAQTFITLARSALSAQDFVERSKRYKLTYEQQCVVDKMKLQLWNESSKGEKTA